MNLGVAAVVLALLPAWLATALQRRVERWLPRHLFVFIIGNGGSGFDGGSAHARARFQVRDGAARGRGPRPAL